MRSGLRFFVGAEASTFFVSRSEILAFTIEASTGGTFVESIRRGDRGPGDFDLDLERPAPLKGIEN